ncbi:hypothetical protein TRFO_28364 [Tritrichomonas foetus]|uniref:Uncharacterized protein n=1 Tax=Tritrichomonas foetus TaxID=1144522 RepID=A0A1J4JZT0_9EUKA|nr:hypothetical protein TRFO_28364 [Tritrichomonas foetus]|eukprot:OHT04194.1 hypothetical protein TRFO_28364 [Tritrichomonas foetus]
MSDEYDEFEILKKEIRDDFQVYVELQKKLASFSPEDKINAEEEFDYFFQEKTRFWHFLYTIMHLYNYGHKRKKIYQSILFQIKNKIQNTHFSNQHIKILCQNNIKAIEFFLTEKIISKENVSSFFTNQEKITYEIIEKKLSKDATTQYKIKFIQNNSKNPKVSIFEKIIRKDDIHTFQQILSESNIDINCQFQFFDNEKYFVFKNISLSMLEYSAFYGSIQIFKFLWIQKGIKFGSNLLKCAVCGNNFDVIHLLESELKTKFDFSCLELAIAHHHYELTEYIISDLGIQQFPDTEILNRSIKSFNALFLYDHCDDFEYEINTLKYLTGGELPVISVAVNQNLLEVVKILSTIECIDLLKQDFTGKNALHLACAKGYYEIVKFLAESDGMNINSTDNNGRTPLHWAVQSDKEVVKYLIQLPRIDLNKENKMKSTPFLDAVILGKLEIVKLLANTHEIDVNRVDKDGNTALHLACEKNDLEMIKFLISFIDPTIKNYNGEIFHSLTECTSYGNASFLKKLFRIL